MIKEWVQGEQYPVGTVCVWKGYRIISRETHYAPRSAVDPWDMGRRPEPLNLKTWRIDFDYMNAEMRRKLKAADGG